MQKKFIALALAAIVLSGCNTMGETVGLGAGAGAVVATVLGTDPVTGAIIGAGAGALCVETNTC